MTCGTCQNERRVLVIGDPAPEKYPFTAWGNYTLNPLSVQFGPMKKYLAMFLLVLLPLQFSWAAAAGYCQHEAGVTANHPGLHTDNHHAADHHESGKDGAPSAGVHSDCAACHLGCAAALTSDLNMPAAATDQDHQSDYLVNPSRAHTERPERPQWPTLA